MTISSQLLRSHLGVLRIGLLILFGGLILLRAVELRLNLIESLQFAADLATRDTRLFEPGNLERNFGGRAIVTDAILFDAAGKVHSRYPAETSVASDSVGGWQAFWQDVATPTIRSSIVSQGQPAGELHLRTSIHHIGWQLAISAGIFIGLSLIAMGIAVVAAKRAVVPMLKPIQRLANAALKVGIRQDYSVRVTMEGDNEWAQLAQSFNAMLTKIESQTRKAREAAERFDLAVTGSAAGIWDWDLQRDQLFLSDRFKELLGFAPEELPNTFAAWEELQVIEEGSEKSSIRAALSEHALANLDVFMQQAQFRTKNGETHWFEIRGCAFRHSLDVAPHRMAGSITDIQEAKLAEERLRRTLDELQEFAYIASHDLREPLRTVSSYVSLLRRRYADQLGDDANEFIDFAVEGAKRMQALIDDLLAYSQAGASEKSLAEVESQAAFEDARSNLASAIEAKSARIEVEPLPRVVAEKTQLTQVFQNLLANAIKFSNGSAPQITVGVSEIDGKWRFQVKDNGIGISEAHHRRIFKIFRRLHLKEDYEGTGIGLAVSQKIIERHGGRIWVESVENEGSTFYFTLEKAEGEGRDSSSDESTVLPVVAETD